MAVIRAVAAVDNSDPLEMEPIYAYIDPDALDTIFQNYDGNNIVEFEYIKYKIKIFNGKRIDISPLSGANN